MRQLQACVLAASAAGCFSALAAGDIGGVPCAKLQGEAVAEQKVVAGDLIPRDVLFGNPERSAGRVSPDGKYISFVAPLEGVMNVWVAPIGQMDKARAVTSDKVRGIRSYFWAYDGKHILYTQDLGGDENWKVYAVDVTSDKPVARDLTPFEEIKGEDGKPIMQPNGKPLRPAAQIEGVSDVFPDEILVGLNNRNPQFHDVYRVNLATGKLTLVMTNDQWAGFLTDDQFVVRGASVMNAQGGNDFYLNKGTNEKPDFQLWTSVAMEDSMTTPPAGFDKAGTTMYMLDSRGRDTGAMFAIDVATGKQTLIAENPKADAGGGMADPKTGKIQAVGFNYLRNEWTVVDPAIQGDIDYLKTVTDGEFSVTSRTEDDSKWTVSYLVDNGPVQTYLYDRANKKAELLFVNNSKLNGLPLAKMFPVVIKARDGMELVSYLTVPPQFEKQVQMLLLGDKLGDGKVKATEKDGKVTLTAVGETGVTLSRAVKADALPRLPLVLNVHGGPWARDSWGYDPEAQWLANRGYACLQVNFRGSTGFGKQYVNAGNKEWAGKMHDDLLDARQWAINLGIAREDKTAVYGGSYGGYAALVAATFTPEVFAANVSVVGPSNIRTLLATIPPYWAPAVEMFASRVGDHRTEEGKAFLDSRSPLSHVDKIKRPLLIGQGANDPRVKQSESDQIVKAMQAKGTPVTYVLFGDEGHGFARPENRLAFYAVTEAFFAQHLGGKVEPIGDDFKGSSITVPSGADQVPDLSKALSEAGK